jgi:hypothetical protein
MLARGGGVLNLTLNFGRAGRVPLGKLGSAGSSQMSALAFSPFWRFDALRSRLAVLPPALSRRLIVALRG